MSAPSSVIPALWQIPETIRVRVGREAGPQRAMLEDGHLLVILHHVPGADDRARRPDLFWRQPDGEWRATAGGVGLRGMTSLLSEYEEQLGAMETAEMRAKTATEYHQVLERIAPALRASRGLHRALQQARELVPDDRDLINYRDQSAAIERTADLLLQDAQFGMNFTMARQAEAQAVAAQKMAKTSHRLNLLAAVFLPVTALGTVFGMDVRSGLADTRGNFILICAVGILIGVMISALLARKA